MLNTLTFDIVKKHGKIVPSKGYHHLVVHFHLLKGYNSVMGDIDLNIILSIVFVLV